MKGFPMRLLYLYPEEWTGYRAREVHTLSTCVALAQSGVQVTLVTAGGLPELRAQLNDLSGSASVPGLHLEALSRSLGPIRSAVTHQARLHPGDPIPQILSWRVDLEDALVVDDTQRAHKAISGIERRRLERSKAQTEREIRYLTEEKEKVEDRLRRLTTL